MTVTEKSLQQRCQGVEDGVSKVPRGWGWVVKPSLHELIQPMAKLNKLFGMTFLVGKISCLNFYFMVHWLSEKPTLHEIYLHEIELTLHTFTVP